MMLPCWFLEHHEFCQHRLMLGLGLRVAGYIPSEENLYRIPQVGRRKVLLASCRSELRKMMNLKGEKSKWLRAWCGSNSWKGGREPGRKRLKGS